MFSATRTLNIMRQLSSLKLHVRLVLVKIKNTVAKLGDTVELECSTSKTMPEKSNTSTDIADEASPLEWIFTPALSSGNSIHIYRNGYINQNFSSNYAVNPAIRGRYNLIMNAVDISFAGTYTCSEPQLLGEDQRLHISAELIVIATDPVCGLNKSGLITEGDYIQMWCAVNYSGNLIPVMKWTRGNEQTVCAEVLYFNTSTIVTSSVTIRLESSDNGVTFTCKTSFHSKTTVNGKNRPDETLATNVPHYQYVWSVKANVLSTPLSWKPTTIALPTCGVIAAIGLVALGLGIALTVKSCIRGNSMNRGRPHETSTQHQDYDMVDESGDSGNPPLHHSTPHKGGTEDNSAENIAVESYSSLKRSSSATFVQPAVYAQLQLYANDEYYTT